MNYRVDITDVVMTTPRLTLRAWQSGDLDDLFAYASVDGVGQMAGWLPHKNKDESRRILEMFMTNKNVFAIVFQEKVIGSLGIEKYNEKELPEFDQLLGCELGYVLSKPYWGQGLMPEAVRAVVQWLFATQKVDFITCSHFLDNPQSRRVQEKCGFKHYKLIPYETAYGIVKDSWLSVLTKQDR